jgi:hypothetical protein
MRSEAASVISIRLSMDWAIGSDCLQWIVYRRRKRRDKRYWNPVGYIGSNKAILLRVLRENSVQTHKQGDKALRELPETFREWIADNLAEVSGPEYHEET